MLGDWLLVKGEFGLDKFVQITVEDGVGVAGFDLCPQIFDHVVRVKDVGADLVAPTGDFVLPFQMGLFFLAIFFFEAPKFGLEHIEGDFSILLLVAL